jgi:hypothetical protein
MAARPCIGSWLQAGRARNKIAAPMHVKIDFVGIVPPSKKDRHNLEVEKFR